MIKLLHDDPFFRVELNETDAIHRAARTARKFASLAEAERAYKEIERALTAVPPGGRLLFDLRAATQLDDPAFEPILTRTIGSVVNRFSRLAVIVPTKHVLRVNPRPALAVFDDEDAAFDHLLA